MLLNLGRAPGQAEPRQAAPLPQLQQTGRDACHSREQEELQARHSGCSISISVLREQGPFEKNTDNAEGAVKKGRPALYKDPNTEKCEKQPLALLINEAERRQLRSNALIEGTH